MNSKGMCTEESNSTLGFGPPCGWDGDCPWPCWCLGGNGSDGSGNCQCPGDGGGRHGRQQAGAGPPRGGRKGGVVDPRRGIVPVQPRDSVVMPPQRGRRYDCDSMCGHYQQCHSSGPSSWPGNCSCDCCNNTVVGQGTPMEQWYCHCSGCNSEYRACMNNCQRNYAGHSGWGSWYTFGLGEYAGPRDPSPGSSHRRGGRIRRRRRR
tara:strand:+ start:1171 stop:1788 length:618 start_codon:yes stop_codon:yes gene_type:complete